MSKNTKVLENKMNENVRNYSFDVLRILACLGVIFNHTVIRDSSKYWPFLLFLYYFCRTAVPIFL